MERLKRIPADDDAHGRKDDDKPLGKVARFTSNGVAGVIRDLARMSSPR